MSLPAAMLLDFGGVLVDVRYRPEGLSEVAREVSAMLEREGISLEPALVAADVNAGWRAYRDYKNAEARRPHPREVGRDEFWAELVAADWPAAARAIVVDRADALCARIDVATKDRPPRAGALELLQELRSLRVPAAIVSNALGGSGSRLLVRRYGFEPYLEAQLYSDEVGVRKPNPRIFELAAAALGIDLRACWYVGDTYDRDVLGGRRAGVALVILAIGSETRTGAEVRCEPDAVVRHLDELRTMLGGTTA